MGANRPLGAGKTKAGPPGQRCPICGAPTRHAVRPFCSRRCADVDLGRWLRGAYRVPSEERPSEEVPGEEETSSDDGG